MKTETQEESNLKNLKTIAFFRTQLWKKVNECREFDSFEVSILDSQCPECKNFVDSNESECNYCNFQFSEKSVKVVKKFDTAGKGKKQCLGCGVYLAVRTGKCDCGYDFIKKIQTSTVRVGKEEISNKKKKKSCYFEVREIKDVNLLIKNDVINNNYLKLIKFIGQKPQHQISNESQEILSIVNLIIKIRNELINTNYKLVTKIAAGYLKRNLTHLKIKDLYQTGTIGLLKAINHYNSEIKTDRNTPGIEKSISFSTYAHWWINKSIIDDINNTEREIRIPQHILNVYKDFNTYYNKFMLDQEREPYVHEIMGALNLRDKKASGLLFAKHYKAGNTIGLDILDLNGRDTEDTNNTNFKFKSYLFKHIASELTTRLDDSLLDIRNIDFDKIKYDKPIYKEIFYSLTGLFGYKEMNNSEAEKEYGITKVTIARIREKTIERIQKQLATKKQEEENETNSIRIQFTPPKNRNFSGQNVDRSEIQKLFGINEPSEDEDVVPWLPKHHITKDPQPNHSPNHFSGQIIEEITIETTIEETITETIEDDDSENDSEFDDVDSSTQSSQSSRYYDEDDGEVIRTYSSYLDD